MQSFIRIEVNIVPSKTEPINQGSGHALFFRKTIEFRNHNLINQPEISGVRHDINLRYSIYNLIEQFGTGFFNPAITLIILPYSNNHFRASFPLSDKLWNKFHRMLHVGVQHNTSISSTAVNAGCGCQFLTEVTRKINIFN